MTTTRVSIHWLLPDDDHEAWESDRAVYAYLHPTANEILYIGKAHGSTVRARWSASDKRRGFWRDLERQRRIYDHRVLVGELATEARLTRQLLADVESILIFMVEPWGNISAQRSRIPRPGLVVRNRGRHWFGPRILRDTADGVEAW